MKIVVNPTYDHLRGFIESIPNSFETEGRIIYSGRNLIKVMEVDGIEINVKRYGIPAFVNRVVYSFFRVPKGRRAFEYPQMLLQKGFETPVPIAYIEQRKCGLIDYSYFVSMQSPYQRNFYEFGNADIKHCKDVVIAFARYTAELHQAGIMHRDYSPGNILFDKINGKYHFMLVDINRMSFGRINVEMGCANFARLWGQKAFFRLLAKEYAQARHADEAYCVERVLSYRKKFWTYFAKKHTVKYNLEL
ncbi:MAG: tyrosine protein kinase [Bacteroides acidifaciens]|uniref:lipopolysaccharide kinase InaA family protein n=1 Tax=Bacteroides acidifaciens TaxID=85831 RepID=UPI0023BF0622|nr:lipopolysaccharide kinase InaA family protein [Bacteroides acidifaciens]MDE6821799.1 tyrosine protein kinase [Bacteroides acidifaciens]MDE6985715.1 tyrosine protein kinase [Bacteroides acidifaciens]